MQETEGFSRAFLDESIDILSAIDDSSLNAIAEVLATTRERGGRLFLAGSGGGAGHASHAACDFRILAGLEAYCVSDNVSELTARVNDAGWEGAYADWLRASRIGPDDTLFVFSVGGGDERTGLSINLLRAMDVARQAGAAIVGIAGRDGGALAQCAKAVVVVPTRDPAHVTPQTEGIQALLWHLLVTHPLVAARRPTWESSGSDS
ncbi:MAG TPA: SIS domain-containing protein [Acidimicrobiia bacterium]